MDAGIVEGVLSHEGGKGQRLCGERDAVDERNIFSMVERAKLDGRVDLCVEDWRCRLQSEGLAWCRDTGTAWIVMDLIGLLQRG